VRGQRSAPPGEAKPVGHVAAPDKAGSPEPDVPVADEYAWLGAPNSADALLYGGGGGSSGGDQTTPPRLGRRVEWECPWPADVPEGRVSAYIRVLVTDRGEARSARVVVDPGHGFGAAAIRCALDSRTTYAAGRNATGARVGGWTVPFEVRFERRR
jgi:hypothetical protein